MASQREERIQLVVELRIMVRNLRKLTFDERESDPRGCLAGNDDERVEQAADIIEEYLNLQDDAKFEENLR